VVTLLVAFALFGAPTSCASTGDGAPDRHDAKVLNRSFSLWDGTETTLADLVADDGRPVVVNLWATWCTPCLEEMPDLQATHEAHDPDVRFLGINVSDSPTKSAHRVAELGITYLQGRDPESGFTVALGAVGLPVTAFIDSGGALAHVHHGRLDTTDLAAAILEHLS